LTEPALQSIDFKAQHLQSIKKVRFISDYCPVTIGIRVPELPSAPNENVKDGWLPHRRDQGSEGSPQFCPILLLYRVESSAAANSGGVSELQPSAFGHAAGYPRRVVTIPSRDVPVPVPLTAMPTPRRVRQNNYPQ
jgi:hypothetical protein